MTEREFIDALCDVRPEWDGRRMQVHDNEIYYVDGAHLGSELAMCVFAGRDEPWMTQAFAVIERALVVGTEPTRNLVVVGLFEAMQARAYRAADPPDVLDAWLGPASRNAWALLIEGWTGRGVRTIEAWQRVVLNGKPTTIVFESADFAFRAALAEPRSVTWRLDGVTGSWVPEPDEVERIIAPLHPLTAVRITSDLDIGATVATLETIVGRDEAQVRFGARADGGRLACLHDERAFVIDLDALVAAWTWIAMPPR